MYFAFGLYNGPFHFHPFENKNILFTPFEAMVYNQKKLPNKLNIYFICNENRILLMPPLSESSSSRRGDI